MQKEIWLDFPANIKQPKCDKYYLPSSCWTAIGNAEGENLKMQILLKSLEWNGTAFFSSIAVAPEDISGTLFKGHYREWVSRNGNFAKW